MVLSTENMSWTDPGVGQVIVSGDCGRRTESKANANNDQSGQSGAIKTNRRDNTCGKFYLQYVESESI